MQLQLSVITLGVGDLERSRRFYVEGFCWTPVFENTEIVFYQMNGFVLGTWLSEKLDADMQRQNTGGAGSFALAHNVSDACEVQPLIDHLVAVGGKLLRRADAPPHGGFRGYVADPDGNCWEIAWNPAWLIDANGHVKFGV